MWEMQIKVQLGKLALKTPLEQKISRQQKTNELEILAISLEHVFALKRLPLHHRDPFDRLLVAQALHDNLVFVTRDAKAALYPITVLW